MTMTFVWTGVALWLALNAAVTVCLVAAHKQSRSPLDVSHGRDRQAIGEAQAPDRAAPASRSRILLQPV